MASAPDYDVIIIGGGPVGLMLGNMLEQKRLSTLLIEKNPVPPAESMAIGITPPSLELFQTLGLDEAIVNQGVKVELAKVHEGGKQAGTLSFQELLNPYPFILAIPQATTIELLESKLVETNPATLRRKTNLIKILQGEQQVIATIHKNDASETEQVTASFLVGCDGHRSLVRELAGIEFSEEKNYKTHFLMADFSDDTDLGNQAHLFFSRQGSVESFPLPKNRRRWILQTEHAMKQPEKSLLIKNIRRQTGYNLEDSSCYSESVFSTHRFVCESYHSNRVVLCGDAAHVMSPVGGQGMNTGFADAEFLANALSRHFSNGDNHQKLFEEYGHFRRTAFKIAADRAERGMWMGTRRGRLASILRYLLLKTLLSPLFRKSLPAYFAMLTIPYRSLKTISRGQH